MVVVAVFVASSSTPVIANSIETTSVHVAQTSLVGQCRRINTDYTGVFQEADTTGTRLAALRAGTVVRLADGGNGRGWIKIDAPTEGYLEARYLTVTSCPSNLSQRPTQLPSTPSVASRCRLVKTPSAGLVIRSQPNASSTLVGGVAQNATVRLSSSPATSQQDGSGRHWIQIESPRAGWISNGFSGQPSNLGYCSGETTPPIAEQPLAPVGSLCRRVIQPFQGLLIRSSGSNASSVVGGVGFGERVTLPAPIRTARDTTGRYWVQVTAPSAGWISNGYPGSSNLGLCP